jgi:hypothetical protein
VKRNHSDTIIFLEKMSLLLIIIFELTCSYMRYKKHRNEYHQNLISRIIILLNQEAIQVKSIILNGSTTMLAIRTIQLPSNFYKLNILCKSFFAFVSRKNKWLVSFLHYTRYRLICSFYMTISSYNLDLRIALLFHSPSL